MGKKRILVIDDEASIRANVLRVLRMEGYETREAVNGALGLAAARAERPDLILCDVMMPEMDGFAVLTALRADPATASVPFIFLTASVEMDDKRFGASLGADGYLTKPFNLAELVALIRANLAD